MYMDRKSTFPARSREGPLRLGQVRVFRPQQFEPVELSSVVERGLKLVAQERKQGYPVLSESISRAKKRQPANIADRLVCLLSLFRLAGMPVEVLRRLLLTASVGAAGLPFARLVLPAVDLAVAVPATVLEHLLKGLQPDDRYVQVQDVLNTTRPGDVNWSHVRSKLEARSSFDPTVSDADFLRNLKQLDEEIFHGRHQINLIYNLGSNHVVSAGQRWLQNWIAKQEKNPLSVYYCYRGLIKGRMSWWR